MKRQQQSLRHMEVVVLRASAFAGDVIDWWPDLDDETAVVQWLGQLWARSAVADAVAVASPVLANRVRQVNAGRLPAAGQVRRLALATARYLVRMQGRPTPFGLFAGAGAARISAHPAVLHNGTDAIRLRADARWLADVIAVLESNPALRRCLRVVTNDFVEVHGGRLFVHWQPHGADPDRDTNTQTSIRHTTVVQDARQHAGTPIVVWELVEKLAADRPSAPIAGLEAVVRDLIQHGVLISSLRPPSTSTDGLAHVLDRLDEIGVGMVSAVAGIAEQLRDVHQHLVGGVSRPDTSGWDVVAQMRALSRRVEQPMMVDLRLGTAVEVPQAVAVEAAAAAQALLQLSPAPYGSRDWRTFHGRFLDRYGPCTVVPVAQLVDRCAGLGFPPHFNHKDLPVPVAPRDQLLVALAQQAALDGVQEVVLNAADISRLGVDLDLRVPNVDLCVDIRAATTTALTAGEFELGVCGAGRSGALTGRFLDLIDEQPGRVAAAYAGLAARTHAAVTAQLSYPPLHPRTENILRAPRVWPHIIALGEHHPSSPNRLPLDDLAVCADADRLYLVSVSRRQVVETVLPHAGARHTMPPLARLLLEIPRAFGPAVTTFDWGTAARWLPFQPRIRYGRTVLSPACWRIGPDALPGPDTSRQHWASALRDLRQRRRLPGVVSVGTNDRRLRLSLDHPMDQDLFRAHVANSDTVITLEEAPTAAAYGWIGGRAHELVIPLAAAAPPAPAPAHLTRPGPLPVITREHIQLPGSAVVHANLYGTPELVDAILIRHLPELFADWPSPPLWWFIRYHNPEPHLRLRLRLVTRQTYGTAVDHVANWASALQRYGLIRELAFVSHHPELGRYGTGPASAAAEELFAADSISVVAQLRALAATPNMPAQALTAASMVDLGAAMLGGHHTGMRWLREHPELAAPIGSANRAVRRHALNLAWSGLHTMLASGPVIAGWQTRAAAARRYAAALTSVNSTVTPTSVLGSLLHLHHNRAQGIEPAGEAQTYRLARAVALAPTPRTTGAPE